MTGKRSLTIVQMNDSHAYFDLHQEMFWQGDHAVYRPAGGYARIATMHSRKGRHNCLGFAPRVPSGYEAFVRSSWYRCLSQRPHP